MTPQDTMRLALEALESLDHPDGCKSGYAKDTGEGVWFNEMWPEKCDCGRNAAIAALREALAQQGDEYQRGFSDGMKEAPTGECWIRVIDEAMVGAHLGVADIADDYGTAKEKLNDLICWSVEADRDTAAPAPQPVVKTPPEWWPAVENILTEFGLDAISFVADFKKASGDYPAQIKQDIPAPQAQQPLTAAQIKAGRTEGYDAEDTPDAWDFEQGVRFAERRHGIEEKQ